MSPDLTPVAAGVGAPHLPLGAGVLAVGDGHLSQVEKHGALQGPLLAIVTEASNVGACRRRSTAETQALGGEGVRPMAHSEQMPRQSQPSLSKGTPQRRQGVRLWSDDPCSASGYFNPVPFCPFS